MGLLSSYLISTSAKQLSELSTDEEFIEIAEIVEALSNCLERLSGCLSELISCLEAESKLTNDFHSHADKFFEYLAELMKEQNKEDESKEIGHSANFKSFGNVFLNGKKEYEKINNFLNEIKEDLELLSKAIMRRTQYPDDGKEVGERLRQYYEDIKREKDQFSKKYEDYLTRNLNKIVEIYEQICDDIRKVKKGENKG